MKYDRFEDLPVWKSAIELALKADQLADDKALKNRGDLCSQLRRASLSVSNNIAEGFERGSTAELLMFIYIARGSAGEVRSMLCYCERAAWAAHLKSDISNLKVLAESCSRQLRGWAEMLQNSDIRGQRHLNEHTAAAYTTVRRRDEFLAKLDRVRRGESSDVVFGSASQSVGETEQSQSPG